VKEMLQEKRKMVEHAEDDLPGNIQTRIVEVEKHLEATNTRIESLDEKLSKNDSWLKNEIIDLKETAAFLEKNIEDARAFLKRQGYNVEIPKVELQKTLIEYRVTAHTKMVKAVSDETVQGKIMWLAKEGFFGSWRGLKAVVVELQKHKWTPPYNSVKNELLAMAQKGMLAQKKSSSKAYLYALPPNVKFIE